MDHDGSFEVGSCVFTLLSVELTGRWSSELTSFLRDVSVKASTFHR